jgi:Spy/CpxP family protein refolding chaperone
MRNKVIIGLLLVSAISFGAYGYHNEGSMMGRGNRAGGYGCGGNGSMMWNENSLSEEHRAEMFEMMQGRRDMTYKESLDVRGKELELEKKLAADKVDWKGVERLNKEISNLKAKRRLEGMKFRKEIEDKYDVNYGGKGTSKGR